MTTSPIARTDAPVVSVITPTWEREAMLQHAYRSFAHQDLPACEWIVIDDSERPSAFMQGLDDARVVYRHLPQRMSAGAKRNLAVALARAEIIAHFDDGEYYAPSYLRTMCAQLTQQRADFVKLSAFFLYSRVYGQFAWWDLLRKSGLHFHWSAQPMTALNFPADHKAFANNHSGYGFSYVYTKRLWAAGPFESCSLNEDGKFLQVALERGANLAHFPDDVGLCLHVLHGCNTSASFPQYLLPEALVTRHFPQFAQFGATLRAAPPERQA
ncbi:glycosyltransferase family 2 protein [Paraburkholderia pallida]|uniref:Glycosyltransferase n=1 Tax=Paraburkholderia pallida TaxID=2547399 RepID=A0A4P7CL39_9BURK|nr:glycosyltransferase [Paraburkholderia pallida]QBQ96388.1 glycosyltransferase [Paraburkholderia pallida]